MGLSSIPGLEVEIFYGLLILGGIMMLGVVFLLIKNIFFNQNIEKTMSDRIKEKLWDEAIVIGTDYLKKNKITFSVANYLGIAYESKGDLKSAIDFFNKASIQIIRNRKLYLTTLLKLASLSEKAGNFNDALGYYLVVMENDEKRADALYEIARFHYNQKKVKKAKDYLEKLLEMRPGLIDARILYGKCLCDLNHYALALKQYEFLEKIENDNAALHFEKAQVLEQLKRYNEAIKSYENFLSKRDRAPEMVSKAKLSIVQLYVRNKDFNRGLEVVQKFLDEPNDDNLSAELFYLYANLLRHCGEEYLSLKMYERVYLLKRDFRDVESIVKRYKLYIENPVLSEYFTSDEDKFDRMAQKLTPNRRYELKFRSLDYYVYSRGGGYVIFYRHIEPLQFDKLNDLETLLTSYEFPMLTTEIYSVEGIEKDALLHTLAKKSSVIEGKEFIYYIQEAVKKNAAEKPATV